MYHYNNDHHDRPDGHWPHHTQDDLDIGRTDSRPPQLDKQLCRCRNGCVCASSRDSTGGMNGGGDKSGSDAAVVPDSESVCDSDRDPSMPNTPDFIPEPDTVRTSGVDEFQLNPDTRELHRFGRTYAVPAIELSDSAEGWASGSPTDSIMLGESNESMAETGIFHMDVDSDYLTDMTKVSPIITTSTFVGTPLLLNDDDNWHLLQRSVVPVLRCQHIHNQMCFELH